jgi:hypothetical protein
MRELDWFKDESRREQVLREEASWRKMFPIQPPAPITGLVDNSTCGCWTDDGEGVVKEGLQDLSTGARMGLLYDIVVELIDSGASGGMYIHYNQFPEPGTLEGEEGNILPDGRMLRSYEHRKSEEVKGEIEILVINYRDCYEEKKEAVTGLEIRSKRRRKREWNIKWRRRDDARKAK